MAPKPAQDKTRALRQEGLSEAEIRRRLQEDGYKPSRISQLLKATRGAAAAEARFHVGRVCFCRFFLPPFSPLPFYS